MECPDCGAPNPPGSAACRECGLELAEDLDEAADPVEMQLLEYMLTTPTDETRVAVATEPGPGRGR